MFCSPMNDHLYSYIHVVGNPVCQCDHIRENNKYYYWTGLYLQLKKLQCLTTLTDLHFNPILWQCLETFAVSQIWCDRDSSMKFPSGHIKLALLCKRIPYSAVPLTLERSSLTW